MLVAGLYLDVALAVILAFVFAVFVGVVLEDVKARLIAREIGPTLEQTRLVTTAIRRLGVPPRRFTTRLVSEDGDTIGTMVGWRSDHRPGSAVPYGAKR